jgi:hypothetical protein
MKTQLKVYSDVVEAGLIQPRREKYSMRDVNRVMIDSLFTPGETLTEKEAVWIVKCSAVFHNTDWSISLSNWKEKYVIL